MSNALTLPDTPLYTKQYQVAFTGSGIAVLLALAASTPWAAVVATAGVLLFFCALRELMARDMHQHVCHTARASWLRRKYSAALPPPPRGFLAYIWRNIGSHGDIRSIGKHQLRLRTREEIRMEAILAISLYLQILATPIISAALARPIADAVIQGGYTAPSFIHQALSGLVLGPLIATFFAIGCPHTTVLAAAHRHMQAMQARWGATPG